HALELDAGVRVVPLDSPFAITAGAGAGLLEGVGVPKVRAFVGLSFIAEVSDKDKDGVLDANDQCPTEPEDVDGFQDADGCPDLDNDLDSILDVNDKCPDAEEDLDGFQDADGCPDLDNDGDGINDVSDQCPNEPETKNGYQDEDG